MKSVLYSLSLLGLAASSAAASPNLADSGANDYSAAPADMTAKLQENILSNKERSQALAFFRALNDEDWQSIVSIISDSRQSPLHAVFRAEYFLAANSPIASAEDIVKLLNDAPDIAQSDQLRRLAARRGVTQIPAGPEKRSLKYQGAPSVRGKPDSITGANALPENQKQGIIKAIGDSNPDQARAILAASINDISQASRTEWQQRIAWSYYIENRDNEALEMARQAVMGKGAWLGDSHWVYGLAAWRLGQYRLAAEQFALTGTLADNPELKSAGHYWSSRAWMRAGYPTQVSAQLQRASAYNVTLYGVLAQQALGVRQDKAIDAVTLTKAQTGQLERSRNGRSALALIALGQTELAEEALRYEARREGGADHETLLAIAKAYSLPALQRWLSIYTPKNTLQQRLAAFPAPQWRPVNGWQVDPALVYAHTLQESGFRTNAVSPANARGLMQLLPGTAADLGTNYNLPSDDKALFTPENNLALGQQFLKELADKSQTNGLLPKVIAAYNAGPTPVGRWNQEIQDQGDPLLYIESIPYSETRAYVGIVMRNYWMYETQSGIESQSAFGLAQGLWPKFPNAQGVELVRINGGQEKGNLSGD